SQPLDQTLIKKPYSEVAHFSVEKPAQFRVKTNTVVHRRRPMRSAGFAYRFRLRSLASGTRAHPKKAGVS
ncbi:MULTISPECIES: hypothetical protein, partial [unclassified Rhizobium]